MEKAYKYRIYPNKEQEKLLQKTFGCSRYVYNYYLYKRKAVYEDIKQTLNYNACAADLTILKKNIEWLTEVDSTALQSSLKDLDLAYQNFFREIKKGNTHQGFPKYKSKKNRRKSYKTKCTNGNTGIYDTYIKLPKIGLVKAIISRSVEGRIINATVTQTPSGKYYVSLCCTEVPDKKTNYTGAVVGIDLGLKEFAITSDGITIKNPRHYRKSEKKLAKLQRKLSRKTKGSSNREKARIKVARQHEKVVNQRNDFLHKTSTSLVKDYDIICLETLKVKNMVKNHKLSKSISDVAWSEFKRQLQYKADWNGKRLQQISSFYASSQLCNVCGYKNPETKNLSVRKWTCPDCNTNHDRDINAAKNILTEGLKVLSA